jgi:aspartyl-tRNA synthetase
VEIFATEIEVLAAAKELPLPVFGEPDYPEDIRLKYRFLDLRRETLHKNIMSRTKIIAAMRRRMTEIGFNEFTTPILTASSPKARATSSCLAVFIRASSMRCRRRRSSTSSF